jgi:ATP-dependent helicase HrpA
VQRLFPGLQDDGNSVSCRLYPTAAAAAAAHRGGVLRLLMLALPQQQRELLKQARADRRLVLRGRDLARGEDLAEDLVAAAFSRVFLPAGAALPGDEASFRACLDHGRALLVPDAEQLLALATESLELHEECRRRLAAGLTGPGAREAAADIESQLGSLVYPGFLAATPPERLTELPRYLRAALCRMDRLAQGKGEARQVLDLKPHLERLVANAATRWASAEAAAAFQRYRWLVEEYRVQLFAQPLGVKDKVSHARLETQWTRCRELQAGLRAAH